MADVARSAGVSQQTVSRVLNGSDHTSPETVRGVNEAILRLGYRRNRAARALRVNRSNTIGIITGDSELYGPTATLLGTERAAHEAGYYVSTVSVESVDVSHLREALHYLSEQGVEGVIVVGLATHEQMTGMVELLNDSVPIVLTDGIQSGPVPGVGFDQVAAARAATQHLLDLGHSTVWHVSGPIQWQSARERMEGWRNALVAAGAGIGGVLSGDWSARSGFAAGQRLIRSTDATAVFVANDQMALGLISAFTRAGRRIPEDLSVVGFDDIPEAEFFSPALTTVRTDFREVGRAALRVLLGQIRGELQSVADPAVLPTDLILRDSTCRPTQ